MLFLGKSTLYSIPLNLSFYVSNLMDIWTLQEVIVDGQYEQHAHIPKNAVVIDIGGSIGDFSIFAEKIRHATQIHSFEPDQERISLFKKNMALHHTQHITLHEGPATSLDQIFKENKLTRCDFMKVDCEGGEYPIFKKASLETLSKVRAIAFEYHLFTPEMKKEFPLLKKKLEQAHFQLIEQNNPVHDTIGFLYAFNSNYAPHILAKHAKK